MKEHHAERRYNYMSIYDEIKQLASTLKRDTEWLTCRAVQKWLRENIQYDFYWNPRGIETTWIEKKGDCTDTAMLMVRMLEYLNIHSHVVHGYAIYPEPNKGNVTIKHDWVIAQYHQIDESIKEIRLDGNTDFPTYQYIGEGVW
jgi:transglutaminase-like putative cysteine protease